MFLPLADVYPGRCLPLPRGTDIIYPWSMDSRESKETTPASSASEDSTNRLLPTVTNENWRGKNNPQERRRIQNRINQRAFRQRQRAGESSKPYKPRNTSGSSSSRRRSEETVNRQPRDEETTAAASSSTSSTLTPQIMPESSTSMTSTPAVPEWDELGQLINRNFMSAATSNAQLVGVDVDALRTGIPVTTPRQAANTLIPALLQPVELQYQLLHDPIIDIIPHPQFRHNILHAITTGQIEAASLVQTIRSSGSLERMYGPGMRAGLVVWGFPEQLASWELSQPFVRKYPFLLQGCEDLLAATNAWRSQRGEQPLTVPQAIV